MNLVFVHGWSVTDTNTYGQLPQALAMLAPQELDLKITHIFLGRYISFHDEVTIDDIARAFEQARKEVIGPDTSFSCITHSTGGPVMRAWIDRYYGAKNLKRLPLQHLIMLAPANHGSALAQLGKSRVGRIKAWFQGIEPGQGVLDWLELGSADQRQLNLNWLDYSLAESGFFPVVLTGEMIDKKLYDYLNSYTGENGSDGVVRVAAANLNYRYIRLVQSVSGPKLTRHTAGHGQDVLPLELKAPIKKPGRPCALQIIPRACHTGKSMGIMFSVSKRNAKSKPVVPAIIDSLRVNNDDEYRALTRQMARQNKQTRKGRSYSMVVVRILDDQGNDIHDFDLFILAGDQYDMNELPKAFFVDRQKNKRNNCLLTFYLDAAKLGKIPDQKIGFRVVARPDDGFVHYTPAEFRSEDIPLSEILVADETLLLDIVLHRYVDQNTFRLDPAAKGSKNFKNEKPMSKDISI